MGLMDVQGPQGGAERLIEILPAFLGWVSAESFRGADGCFKAHQLGLRNFSNPSSPLGGAEKLMKIFQAFGDGFLLSFFVGLRG